MEAGQTNPVVQSQAVESAAGAAVPAGPTAEVTPVVETAAVEATEATVEAAPTKEGALPLPLTDREFAIENLRRLASAEASFDGGVQLRACELILVLGSGGAASAAAIAR